jgi:hypothetical protein
VQPIRESKDQLKRPFRWASGPCENIHRSEAEDEGIGAAVTTTSVGALSALDGETLLLGRRILMDRKLQAALLAPKLHRAALSMEDVAGKLIDLRSFAKAAELSELAVQTSQLAVDLVEAASQLPALPPPKKRRRPLGHDDVPF